MTYEQIRAVIIARMMVFTGIEQSRIDYQTGRFTPPEYVAVDPGETNDKNLWCRLTIETARPVVQGLCQPRARVPGNIIIQCFDRAISQVPTVALVKLADALAAHFQFWETEGLMCREAQLINAGQSDEYCQANVQIYFIAG